VLIHPFCDFIQLKAFLSGKISIVIFTFLLFSSWEIQAQKIGYGPKLGANASFFRGNMLLPGMRGLKPGFTIGGYMSMKFPKQRKWQLEVDLLYTSRGNHSKFFNSEDERDYDIKYNIGYLEVPILFKYMLNRGGMTRPYFIFGPTYCGILGAKKIEPQKTLDVRSAIKRDDFGLTVGWGITGFLINHWYHLDIRYYHGFINLSDNLTNYMQPFVERYQGQVINDYYNSTLSLTVGISLERPEQYFLK
jgi:hypothetical protein